MKKRIACLFAVLMLFVNICTFALAKSNEFVDVSSEKYITAVADHKISKIYGSYKFNSRTDLDEPKNREYQENGNPRFISKGDECRIVDISPHGTCLKVKYPLNSGGWHTAWVKASEFTTADFSYEQEYGVPGKEYVVYKYPGKKWGSSKIFADDNVWFLLDGKDDSSHIYETADGVGYYQVIYPVTSNGTYKMGWVKAKGFKIS